MLLEFWKVTLLYTIMFYHYFRVPGRAFDSREIPFG